jgi:hypothetical protein
MKNQNWRQPWSLMNVLLALSPPTPRTERGVGHPLLGFINKKQERSVLFREGLGHPSD